MGRQSRFGAKIALAVVLLIVAVIGAVILNRHLEKTTYKLKYIKTITKYSKTYEIDPYLVAAVIHVESGNKEKAVSRVGAVGLMQIMPETAKWIAQKLDDPQEDIDLTNPDTNIKYGCWYMRFLFDRFEVNETVIAAYNAGHNRVLSWLNDQDYSVDGEALHEIPYKETRHYVERVQRAYDKYKTLYPDAF